MTTIFRTLIFITIALISYNSHSTIFEHSYVNSPYLQVTQGESQLSLDSTDVSASINGIIADVTVSQTYKNLGDEAIEAIYVFPASPSAAVYGLTLNVNGRITKAVIKEKNQARKEYEEAKEEGKSASLLVQQGPNIFSMNVANILPSDTIKVELKYVEKLSTVKGQYTFIYPASIGPKYGDFLANSKGIYPPEIKQSYSLNIQSAGELYSVESTNHEIIINEKGIAKSVSATINNSNRNKPFVFRYSLRGDDFNEGVLVSKGEENHFLLMVQPPKEPSVQSILPREYIFIVDVSGSMNGMPTETSKNLMAQLLYVLEPKDKFNIIQFAGGSQLLAEVSLDANEENLDKAFVFIEQPDGSGGTEILPALEQAMKLPQTEGYSRSIIVMTDGLVSVEREAFDLLRKNLGRANLFAFGVANHEDYGFNQYIIEGLANIGQTDPIIITRDKDVDSMVKLFRDYVSQPLLSNIQIEFGQLQPYDLINDSFPDVFTDRPLIISGKWSGDLSGEITIKGNTPNGSLVKTISLESTTSLDNSSLQYLWARDKLKLLADYNAHDRDDKLKSEITELGLKYNLLTEFTSFIAVDEFVRSPTNNIQSHSQNLLANGSGFKESTIEIPLESVEAPGEMPEFVEVDGSLYQSLAIDKAVDIKIDLSINQAQCFVGHLPMLGLVLDNYESFIFEFNGKVVHLNIINDTNKNFECYEFLNSTNP